MKIELENIFKENIRKGVDLFLGAGFSVLANNHEGKIPLGDKLLDKLKIKFPQIASFPTLPKACSVLQASNKEDFYKFIIKEFSVKNFDELYKNLFNIKIKNIFSVNVDDLIYKIYEDSKDYYITDTLVRGEDNNSFAIAYNSLHGSVRYPEKGFIFSDIEIASAYSGQSDSWQSLRQSAVKRSVIFWGWSFKDSDIIEAIYKHDDVRVHENINKWIMLHNPQDYEIQFFHALNFNIITGSTKDLLGYLEHVSSPIAIGKEGLIKNDLPTEWLVPKPTSVLSYPIQNFFEGDSPQWSYIFSSQIPKLHYFKEISDLIAGNHNIIFTGIPASGKSTLLMQLANEKISNKIITYFPSMTSEYAKQVINKVKGKKIIIFLDNCLEDFEATNILLSSGIQFVGCDRDDRYENLAYLLNNSSNNFEKIDISEIDDFDCQKIIDSIPGNILNSTSTKIEDKTIFDLLRSRINVTQLENRIISMINKNKIRSPLPTEIFILICYVHSCGVPVSYDMIFSYCHNITAKYNEVYKYIEEIGRMVKDAFGESFAYLNDINFNEQDYYQCRTRHIAELIIDKSRDLGLLKKVLTNFFENISTSKICRYDIFRRKAFDADLITRVFSDAEEGEDFYNLCKKLDESSFLCQQAALYLSRKYHFKEAFKWIEDAKKIKNTFSIKNTHAIIMFNANISQVEKNGHDVYPLLCDSMDILENCYRNDRRKGFHAKIFSDQAIKLYNIYGYEKAEKYLLIALEWLESVRHSSEHSLRTKRELKKYFEEIKNILRY